MDFDGPEFTYEELKQEVRKAAGKEKWVLRQLARGLRPTEIEELERYEVTGHEVRRILQEHMGEEAAPHQCRHVILYHLASGLTTENDAKHILGYKEVK